MKSEVIHRSQDTVDLYTVYDHEDRLFVSRLTEYDWITGHGNTVEKAEQMAVENYLDIKKLGEIP